MLQHKQTLKALYKVKEARHTRVHVFDCIYMKYQKWQIHRDGMHISSCQRMGKEGDL